MNVLMVHPHDLWHDPWTIRILELARGLQQRGHRVTLCHLPRRDRPEHAPLRQPLPDDPPVHALRPRQQNIAYNYRRLTELAQDCDLIHLQKCFAATALPVLWVSRRLGKPLHYDWDDDETAIARQVDPRRFSRLQLAIYERRLPHFAHTLSYSSQALRDRALKLGYPPERMWQIPVGADTQRFHPQVEGWFPPQTPMNRDHLTVLYIGQLEGAAHAHRLVEAAPLVLREAPRVQFLFVGGGEQLGELQARAQASPARDALRVAGYVQADRIPSIIAAADICVACFDDTEASRAKSPLKVAEYLAGGKPIVASRVGDVPWMMQDCGITVAPDSSEALAQGILTYVRDERRRQEDGQRARQRALECFTWDRGVTTLLHAYERCIS